MRKEGAIWISAAAAILLGVAASLYLLSTPEPLVSGSIQLGEAYSDCDECPEMMLIQGGAFHMGRQIRRREVLLHRVGLAPLPKLRTVDVKSFAIGRTEVTFAQWDACVADGGCRGHKPTDKGWGRGARPVIDVSWFDAQAYVSWLSLKTGRKYRLPSEAEWEYAARAGTTTPFSWGPSADRNYANFGNEACPPCSGEIGDGDRWLHTAPVAQFPPNAFGLHDMHGNVYEWTQDCLEPTENQLGSSPVSTGDCSQRVMRGGGWHNDARRIQADYRGHVAPSQRSDRIGFRVVHAP